MITITVYTWRATAHCEEQDYTVKLNGVALATFSTYLSGGEDPQLLAAAFARTLVQAVRPTLSNVQALLGYREGSAPYDEAAKALQLFIEQIDMEEEHAADCSSISE